MNNNIYVIGHKNPDSDSICSAITYANLLNKLGKPAIACRQGPLNEETKFILKRFHQENPLLLTDARVQIKDIELDKPTFIRVDNTVHHAWHLMVQSASRCLFVRDKNDMIVGVCTTSDLAKVRIHPDAAIDTLMSTATLKNIERTIGGHIIYDTGNFTSNGIVHIITLDGREANIYNLKDGISILSGNPDKQLMCIEAGAKLLIITCGQIVSQDVVKYAKEMGCSIITTEHDTMHTARVVTESYSVDQVMTENFKYFNENEYVSDAAAEIRNARVREYPVLNDEGEVVGAISRYNIRDYQGRNIVLVDHSATNQAIKNLKEAEIKAIIDHHHIGDVQTDKPIEYRNHICGCTCTIIAKMYREEGVEPDQDMAGIMLSAILSDTLNLKSATVTDEDRETVAYLAKLAGIEDVNEYAREMLGASVSLYDSTPHEILNRDLKFYEIGNYKFGIGQTNYSHMEDVQAILPDFKKNLQEEQANNKLDLLVMLFTDVMGGGSLFVYDGPMSEVMEEVCLTKFDDHSGFNPYIISRKQQMLPMLYKLLQQK